MPRRATSRPVQFSNVEKKLFPSGFTKGEMVRYYLEVAPYILPHLKDRPITLIRFPDGTRGESFYEKNAPGFAPKWIETARVSRREHEGFINYILVNNRETLAWCANLAAIEFHPFLHRAPAIEKPTHIAFDLDPGEGADIFTCAEVAFLLRELFAGLGLESFPKVSGSKGIQLYVPLHVPLTYDNTQPFAKTVAELMAKRHPKLVVSQMPKALRRKRVLIDWSQNSQSKTTVGVYSLRAKHDQPFVSMPVRWKELEKAHAARDRDALFFSPAAALARLKKAGDLFAPVLKLRQRLPDEFMRLGPGKSGRRGSLRRYAEKRDFTRTREPEPVVPHRSRQGSTRRFVIQKHAASHLHYDFRLEMEGTLRSWAVPKGLPTELGVRRSAFQVEDHPIDYLQFEGTIPKGQYGGGTVMVWDIGTYEVLGGNWHKGDLKLWLSGKKLRGEWHIFRIKSEEAKPVWLVQKADKPARAVSARQEDRSVLSGRSMAQIAKANDAQWQSNRGTTDEAPESSTRRTRKVNADARTDGPRRTARHATALAFVEPMAAQPTAELPDSPDWLYEVKWDGFRALILKDGADVRLLSRNNKSLARDFPSLVERAKALAAERVVIDGEIVALDAEGRPSFQALQHRSSDTVVEFYGFDLLELEGDDLREQPLEERRLRLEAVLKDSELRVSPELSGSAADVVAAVGKMKLEGVVAKRRDSPYRSGERHSDWQKLRLASEQEFVVGGFKPGMAPFESILVGYHDGRKLLFASKVRAGFNVRSRQELWAMIRDHLVTKCPFANLPDAVRKGRWGEGITPEDMKKLRWVKPRVVVQIAFLEWTEHGHLRHAAFRGIRRDKPAKSVVRETS